MSRIIEQLKADLDLKSTSSDLLGLEIVNKLVLKGFCVLSNSLEAVDLEAAIDEIDQFDELQKWDKVNSAVQEGLLGVEGSARVAELPAPDDDETMRDVGEGLTKLDQTITQFGFRIEPYLDRLNIEVSLRTHAMVHKAGEPDEVMTPLTPTDVKKWLSQFVRHNLMVLIFIGPDHGTLELQPYEEDADMCEIQTPPGTIVILRPDLMSHKHFSPGKSLVISSFFLQGSGTKKHTEQGQVPMIPAARELDQWMIERLRIAKERHSEDAIVDPDIPGDWRKAMNHMYHQGQMITVRGTACLFPGHDNLDTWAQVQMSAPDYAESVPLVRWDHQAVWVDDPNCWKIGYSYCRHGHFMDGIELFDPKVFGVSPAEARAMDPHQRKILEIGYAALYSMGMKKNTLNNKNCGVYVGCGNQEWGTVPKEAADGALGTTGGAMSINSGRFSFTLGLKGPALTLDSEASSGATAVYMAAECCQTKGRALPCEFAVAIGASMILSPQWWPSLCAMGDLSQGGRCFSFDGSAGGYIRGDGVASAVVKPASELLDGGDVHDDEARSGIIAGATLNNNGASSSLNAPHGPGEQEAIAQAIQNAGVDPMDVDAVEAFGCAKFLDDAVEISSHERAHRSHDNTNKPLIVSALKSSQGNQDHCAGMASFLKVIYSLQVGITVGGLHLRQLNPHIDMDTPCTLATESVEQEMQSSFSGFFARGSGGSNLYMLCWGQVNYEKLPPRIPARSQDVISFWPGGGGMLPPEQQPNKFYSIVGSWSNWKDPAEMEAEGDGRYGFTIVLGINRWEQFQIWLDGDSSKVLHPGSVKASKDSPVVGPDTEEDSAGLTWIIDGRSGMLAAEYQDAIGSLQSYSVEDFPDKGRPGDMYRVHLSIAGKWRTLSWEKVKAPAIGDTAMDAWDLGIGSYYLTGVCNFWELQEMTPDPEQKGIFRTTVELKGAGGEFHIVRNMDFEQVIYPDHADAESGSSVLGPDDWGEGIFWSIQGQYGNKFMVEFERNPDLDNREGMQVRWQML